MQIFKYTAILFGIFIFAFSACTSNSSEPPQETMSELEASPTPVVNPNAIPHYQCPNRCEGGVNDFAGDCPVCGTALAHNEAWHNSQQVTPLPGIEEGGSVTVPAKKPATPEPAQNAAGVWHYICDNGCPGGAGALGACTKCGGTMSHNTAYHQ